MSNKIGAKIVLEGEAEYRKAIKNINTEQKELRSEMRLCTSQFAGQQNSIAALTKKGEILSKQYDAQAKKVEIYSKAVEEAAKRQEEAGNKVDGLKSELEEANRKMEEMSSSTDTSNEALEEQQKVIEELKNKLALAEDGYSRAQMVTNNWQTSLNNAQADLNGLSHEIQNNDRYLDEAQNSMDGCADSIDEYGNEVEEAQEQTSTFADVLKAELVGEAIKKGISIVVDGLKSIASSAITMGSNFEAAMSNVAATMGITADEIHNGSAEYEILEKAAKECGKTTKYSASEAADALNYLALAGYDAAKAAKTLPSVLNLAAAGGMELGAASDLVTDSMAALGMETSELENYIDEMARTSQKSNTSVAQLGEATLVCAGTASLTEQSLETLNAELGVLANNGLKGAEGGTKLRNILLSLSAPTDTASAAMKELGLQTMDSSGNMRDLNDIMIDLNKALAGISGTGERTKYLNKIFNGRDIAGVTALLKGTGLEFENLKKELLNCEGAAKDMAETMGDNLQGKVTILNSALEGLGITGYEKIEGVLKESVEAATDSIGRLQDSMENGELGDAMDDMAEALGEAAEKAIGFGEDALPVLIDGLTWIIENSDLIISGIAGITAANVAHNKVIPLITAVTKAWNDYRVANEGATVAQWALNAAKNAFSPAGLITAIAAVTAAITTYVVFADSAYKDTKRFIDSAEREIETLNNNAQARKDSTANNKAESEIVKKLTAELENLNSQEKLSTDQKTRLKMVVDQLNTVMPELNLTIDEQTGKLEQSNEEIEKYIENLQRRNEMAAYEDKLQQIIDDQIEAQTLLNKTTEEYDKFVEGLEEPNVWWKQGNIFEAIDFVAGTTQLKDMNNVMTESQQMVDDLGAEYESLSAEYERFLAAEEEVIDGTEELNQVLIEHNGTTYAVSSEVAASIDQLDIAYADAYSEAEESLKGQIGLFEELKAESDVTVEQMSKNLQTQAEVMTTYTQDLQTAAELAKKGLLDEGLLGAISELGIDGAGYLHELVTASETDSAEFNEVMQAWAEMTEAKTTLAETMADLSTGYSSTMEELVTTTGEMIDDINSELADGASEMEEAGENLSKGLENGVLAGKEGVVKTGEDIALETIEAIRIAWKVNSPSRVAQEIGEYFTEGLGLGISKNKEDLISDTKTLGTQTVEGLKSGIESGKSKVIESIKNLCTRVIQTAKDTLGIHSPSKEFAYMGEMSVEGYENAVTEGMDECAEAVHEAMATVLDYDYESATEGQEAAAEAVKNLTAALVYQGKVSAESGTAIFDYIDGNEQLGESAEETAEKIKKLQEAYGKAKEEALDSIDSQVGLFEKLEMKSDVSTKDMIESLRSQTAYMNTYGADLTMAAELVCQGLLDDGLLGAIREIGINGAGYLHELVNASQKDMESFQAIMAEWAVMTQVKDNLSDALAGFEVIYGDKLDDIAELQQSKGKEVESQASSTAESTKKTASDTMNEMVSTTSDGINSMTDMVSKKAPEVEDAAVELCSAAISGFKATLDIDSTGKSRKFASIGYSIPQGIAEGINDGQDLVTNAVKNVINNAIGSIDFDGLSDTIVNKINKELGGLVD